MTAGTYDFTIEQGTDLSKTMTFYTDSTKTTTVDLSSVTMRMQIRNEKNSVDFIDELTDSNSRINTDDAATGVIILIWADLVTTAFDFATAVYDLEFEEGGVITRILEGSITLNKEVTK